MIRAHGALGIEIKKLITTQENSAKFLRSLAAKYGDAGSSVDTAAMQVKRASVDWAQFKENVGNLGMSLVQELKENTALEIAP